MMFGMNFFMDKLFVSSVLLNAWDVLYTSVEVGVGEFCFLFYVTEKNTQKRRH